ncbi:uncharacterized protein V6R79_023802 [Siganus canaliculatus]
MYSPIVILIVFHVLCADVCAVVDGQTLKCPYEVKHENRPKVWCKQSSNDCCRGIAFRNCGLLDEGKVQVTETAGFFTVTMLNPSHGEGVYWCGVLSQNNTVIKLAQGYFYSSPVAYVWSFIRWILLPVLPVVAIVTSILCRS